VLVCFLVGNQLFSQPAQNVPLEDVGNAELGTRLNKHLKEGDLASAAPILQEFRKRMNDGELPKKNLDKFSYLIGLGYMQQYSKKQDKEFLRQAATEFQNYIDNYPGGADIHYVFMNKVDCHRGNGEFEEAIKTLSVLLDSKKPFLRKLRSHERLTMMEKMVQACYFVKDWETGMPWFEQFLKLSRDREKRTMAAAALTEAYVDKEMYDKIDVLLPHLNTNTKSRFDPRLNFQFLQAGDALATKDPPKNDKASLFYSLTMTPKEISSSYKGLMDDLKPRLNYYRNRKKKFGDNFRKDEEKLLGDLEFEWDSLVRKKKRVDDLLKDPKTDYSKDLRWRKAQNYQAMGRNWEAFWGFMGLVTDYPKASKENRENYLYATFVLAEKVKKRGVAREIADRYLKNPEFQKYAYEVGLRLANIYRDQAQNLKTKADTAQTPPEADAFRQESNENFDEMWGLCTKLLDVKPEDKLANNVVFMMGSGWIQRGEHDETKWNELIETFEELAKKVEGDKKPDMHNGLHYWSGLALLYQQEYERGHKHFDIVVKEFPKSDYYEDAMFRRGVCAKGMEDFETARSNFTEFKNKYPKSKMVIEAEVFMGDMAAAEDPPKEDLAIQHYKNVVFEMDYGTLAKDFKFIDYAVYEAMSLSEKPETPDGYRAAKSILQKYIDTHEEGDHSKAQIEIARLDELLGDPREMFKRYYETIISLGNDRDGLGVDETLRKYNEKYDEYHARFTDTFNFLKKMKEDKAWRDKVLADRNELFLILGNFGKMADEVKDKFTLNAEFRKEAMADVSTLDPMFQDYKSRLEGMPPKPPKETFTDLLQQTMNDGRDTLKYRLMMFLDYVYKDEGTSLKEEASFTLPQFFDIPDFQKASPGTLLWMAEYNLDNGSLIAGQKAKIALASILKSFPGTEDAELPALILLSKLERDNAGRAPSPQQKEMYHQLALKYYKIAYERYPAGKLGGVARMGMGDMNRVLGDNTSAILIYRDIASYSGWKGPLHAEASFKMGLTYYDQNQIDKAFPYFEATYVRYRRYSNWAAQGMLYHARCLKKLGHAGDARNVLQEGLQDPKIRASEWFDELNREL